MKIKYYHPEYGEMTSQVETPDQLGGLIKDLHSFFARRYGIDVAFEVKVNNV